MALFFRDMVLVFGPIFSPNEFDVAGPGIAFTSTDELLSQELVGYVSYKPKYRYIITPVPKDNILVRKLKIVFDIKKNMENNPSAANVKIYNLTKEKWDKLTTTHREMRVYVYAGYVNNFTMLYSGDVTNTSYYKEGADWIGSLEAGDGALANSNSFVNISCEENSSVMTAANAMLDSFNKNGVNVENAKDALTSAIGALKTTAGQVFSGNSSREFENLMQNNGLRTHINNSELKVIPFNRTSETKAIYLTPLNGLVESPKNMKEGIRFQTLLIPGLDVGSIVTIGSAAIKGSYVVDSIQYKGDTHGNNWNCLCEAKEYPGIPESEHPIKFYEPADGFKIFKSIDTLIRPEDYPEEWQSNYVYDKEGNYIGTKTPEAGFDRFYDTNGDYVGGGA